MECGEDLVEGRNSGGNVGERREMEISPTRKEVTRLFGVKEAKSGGDEEHSAEVGAEGNGDDGLPRHPAKVGAEGDGDFGLPVDVGVINLRRRVQTEGGTQNDDYIGFSGGFGGRPRYKDERAFS